MSAFDFDLFVIGGGSGGIASVNRAALYGKKCALIEMGDIGGTCVNVGCVPKKVMWYSAQIADAIKKYGPDYGFDTELKSFEWKKLINNRQDYIKRIRASYDSVLSKNNIDVIHGFAKFIDKKTIEVNGEKITADHILIATGTQASLPDIEGVEFGIDSNGFFELQDLPKRTAIIGSGYIAVELAGVLNSLGSNVQLFIRKGKRLLGLTEPGQALLGIVERMLVDADNIKRLADDFNRVDEGTLTIATTHTQARYVLPPIVNQFKKEFPKVHLILQQASPVEITEMLLQGEADIGIATESLTTEDNLASVPFYNWQHSIITPQNHPLASKQNISIADLAEYPLITYHGGFTGRSKIDKAFEDAGVDVDIVMSALDADVIKTYVELNMGVGIVNNVAYDVERDYRLKQIPTDIFGLNTTWIAVRKGHLLRGYGYEFISLCSPDADIKALKRVAYPED